MQHRLGENEVHVWFGLCDELLPEESLEDYLTWLADDERQRYDRYYFDKDRRQFLAARVLVRSVLSRYAPLAPAEWVFDYGPKGKPFLAPQLGLSHLRFNHSHTRHVVACAIARDHEVGVDVEHVQRDFHPQVVKYCLSPSELARFSELDAARQSDFFFRHWTLKEAYVKARGLGLSLPLSRCSFTLAERDNPQMSLDDASDTTPEQWQFHQCLVDPRHLLAVALQCPATPRCNFTVTRWPRPCGAPEA